LIPWHLYNLTPRDQSSPLIRPFFRKTTKIVPIGQFVDSQSFPAPQEDALLVTSIAVSEASNGLDNGLSVGYQVFSPANTSQYLETAFRNAGAANPTFFSSGWHGSPLLLLMPGQFLQLEATMTTSAASWIANYCVAGVTIPRGTLSLT